MWRSILLTSAVLLVVQSARAQQPLDRQPPPGSPGSALPVRPGASWLGGVTPAPGTGGVPMAPGLPPGPTLKPPQATPSPEKTITFNTEQAELRWQDNRWQLVAGTAFLKDFGRQEAEGRQVLRVIRDLHLNTLTTLGSPRPIMEYWLSQGQAPRGIVTGLRTLPIDDASLKAEQVQGQWCVHDATRILFNFGPQADACRQAAEAIQRYGFTQVAYVGQAAPVMLVFLANSTAAAPKTAPVTAAAGRQQPGHAPAAAPQQTGGVVQASLRLPGTEAADRVAIDARQVQVRHDGIDWKLAMGNHVIANFGPNQADAQLAQAALRYYRCSEQVFVGNPKPLFSYFLSGGMAPHGTAYAYNAITFHPEALQVRQLGTDYVLHDGAQVVMSFGGRAAEARQTLEAIQRYKFDRLATFGRGDQSLTLFVRSN
jgi:hypothetical protein